MVFHIVGHKQRSSIFCCSVVLVAMNFVRFVKRSTITITASFPAVVQGNEVMTSIGISTHLPSGISNG
ncbi:hypothetical protein PHMEG_00026560 [Phytophthora megakarya]|uniref:Uncharacterized protein n=1 Tax=Phytophthora megakarya TaxID=4795 RepID=A0A225V9B9_9STRA|nr:hypothetical protein PHMEG_00026560 [Phytophthora megakarya]